MSCICHYNGGLDAPNRIFEYSHELTASIFTRVAPISRRRSPRRTRRVSRTADAGRRWWTGAGACCRVPIGEALKRAMP